MNLENVANNLSKRGFKVSTFETNEDACNYLNREIDNTTVGFGGSITLKELGLFDSLSAHNTVWWHGKGTQLKEYGGNTLPFLL